jgi:hypothetical protein
MNLETFWIVVYSVLGLLFLLAFLGGGDGMDGY